MTHEQDIALLQRLVEATFSEQLIWTEDEDSWYSTKLGNHQMAFHFLYYEATNQIGADRRMIEFMMPGRNAVFACGTKGFDLFMEIVNFGKKQDSFDPLKFLNDELQKLSIR